MPIVDDHARDGGVITAEDLTRLMEHWEDFLNVPVTEIMTPSPKVARADEVGSAAMQRMKFHGIMALPVGDGDRLLKGIVHLQDLMKIGAL